MNFKQFMQDNMEDITEDQFLSLSNYVLALDEIITRNMVKQANDQLFKQQMDMIKQGGQTGMEQTQGIQSKPMVMDENKTEDIINTNGEVSPQL